MERIIITFSADGTFRGASVTDFNGLPAPLDEAALNKIAPAIGATAIANYDAVVAERDSLIQLKTTMEQTVMDALKSGDPAQFAAIGMAFVTPAEEKARAEKLAQYEALKTELGLT